MCQTYRQRTGISPPWSSWRAGPWAWCSSHPHSQSRHASTRSSAHQAWLWTLLVQHVSVWQGLVCVSRSRLCDKELYVCQGAVCVSKSCLCVKELYACHGAVCVSWSCMCVMELYVCHGAVCVSWSCMRVKELLDVAIIQTIILPNVSKLR